MKQLREMLDNRLPKVKNKRNQLQTKSMVTITYVKGVSEDLQRTFRRNGVATSIKPRKMLRQVFVHSKDKRSAQDSAGVV